MTYFSVKWKPDKAETKLRTAQAGLFPGEDVWFFGFCNNFKPFASELAVTPLRLVALFDDEVKFSAPYDEIVSLTPNQAKGTIEVVTTTGSMLIKMVPSDDFGPLLHYYEHARSAPTPPALLDMANAARAATRAAIAARDAPTVANAARAARRVAEDRPAPARAVDWSKTIILGKPSAKAIQAIQRQCQPGELPWLILTSSGGAGTLTAFDDRLAIIKTGALTSYMAGSLGGERSATFHFPDITGIEFNSGFVVGVLEVLTASYNGTANRDYWRGSGRSPNSDTNNPWTLSNCLPLSKDEYNGYLSEINELKARVSRSKHRIVEVVAPAAQPTDDVTLQLERLARLRSSGDLSEDEFAALKARLIG